MPPNERCVSSEFHGYDVKSASACTKSLLEAGAARPPKCPLRQPIAATSVVFLVSYQQCVAILPLLVDLRSFCFQRTFYLCVVKC